MKSLLSIPKITRMTRRSLALPMLCACMLLVASLAAHGQSTTGVTNVDDTTSVPIPGAGHDYIKMLSETVNPANGSVSLRIQLPIPPNNSQGPRHRAQLLHRPGFSSPWSQLGAGS